MPLDPKYAKMLTKKLPRIYERLSDAEQKEVFRAVGDLQKLKLLQDRVFHVLARHLPQEGATTQDQATDEEPGSQETAMG